MQHTSFARRISDWSSDVCSSDLLTRRLLELCGKYDCDHSRDVFRYYRSDAASGLEAGNDIRTALVCFALDASHGYERSHEDSLIALARLLALYMQSKPLFARDKTAMGPLGDLPPTRSDLLPARSEEHTSELQSLMRISYAVFCLKKKKQTT